MSALTLSLPQDVMDQIVSAVKAEVIAEVERAQRPYLTIEDAAKFICAPSRQRIDNLLSAGVLTRHKEGSKTLISRQELTDYVEGRPTGRLATVRESRRRRAA